MLAGATPLGAQAPKRGRHPGVLILRITGSLVKAPRQHSRRVLPGRRTDAWTS